MNEPLINIITRASRKESILISIGSVKSQTYKNYHHIITYETEEMKEYLTKVVNKEKTTLVKVPNLQHFPELSFSYNHHDKYTKHLNPNLEFWEKKVHINREGFDKNYSLKVKSNRYEKNGLGWATDFSFTFRMNLGHFPYNQYLKIAERYLKEGWVMYLDDDDVLSSNSIIEKFSSYLAQVNEDILVLNRVKGRFGIKPSDKIWFENQVGLPLVLGATGASNFIFHSKYADYTAWDEWRGADYRTAKCLEEIIPNKVFIDKVLINVT